MSETIAGRLVPAGQADDADERLAYRGVFSRMLIRPEIGSVIAAAAIWSFFWAVSDTFGLVGGTASILDVASTLGIMAVAVSMLMVGGEFDLSSGAATGAFGILTLLLVRDVTGEMGGAGMSLWVALPLTLIVALMLGWFNGMMVNRTSLPSFIVTLGSFFILKGLKLGFSKLIVDQIQVGKMDDLALNATERGGDKGYAFFSRIFAAEWERTEHIWNGRDLFYTVACFAGLSLVIIGFYELRFARKATKNTSGLVVFIVGLLGLIAGNLHLHARDGVTQNTVGALIIAASIFCSGFGLAIWRYQRETSVGWSLNFSLDWLKWLLYGLVALTLSVLAALSLDKDNSASVALLFTEQGVRAIIFVSSAVAGAVFFLMAANIGGRHSHVLRSALLLLTAIGTTAMAFFVRSQSESVKFRSEVFSVMLLVAIIMASWAMVSVFYSERRYPDQAADRLGNSLISFGVVAATIGVTLRLLFTVQAEIDAGIPPARFSVRNLWFLIFTAVCTWILGRTSFGSWTFAVGGNKQSARQVGVPAARTKVQLFMLVSFAAWLVSCLLAFRLNTIQAGTGNGLEFEYIIAAVVGGTALTGGYGSALGASIGAVIMAMAVQGIPASRWNSDWRFVFLGVILLTAVIGNNFIRSKAEANR